MYCVFIGGPFHRRMLRVPNTAFDTLTYRQFDHRGRRLAPAVYTLRPTTMIEGKNHAAGDTWYVLTYKNMSCTEALGSLLENFCRGAKSVEPQAGPV